MTTSARTPTTAGDAELRAARRDRVFAAMATARLDVLVLGRRDSVAYATGARSLWTAGTRPFGAACVLVARPRSTHVLSTWDAGVPPEVPFGHLYGITWNPATMAASLAAIPGLPEARRLGVDALSPGFERAAHRLAPGAELVPADDVLRAARAVKLPAEVDRVRAAVAVAAAGVAAATAALAAGATPVEARAAAVVAAAAQGVTVPSSAPVVQVVDGASSLIHVDIGLLVDGYEGGLGRTVALPGPGPDDRWAGVVAAQRRLLDACRPTATAPELRAAAGGATRWMVRGSGMGFEPPVVTDTVGESAVVEQGMVLSVEVEVAGLRRRDLAVVGADATDVF
jgi:Xaa-Pro aminopeptidase